MSQREPSVVRRTALLVAFAALLASRPSAALKLTGILLQAVDLTGQPLGPVWHTSSGQEGRPLGVSTWFPNELRSVPLANGPDGELFGTLLPYTYVATLFWQYLPGEFPPAMVMNLYFNGDNLNPGISIIIPARRGLTQFQPNNNPTTLSLYLREVENTGGPFYDDGDQRARIGVAFYLPSSGPTDQWRPNDFTNLDRVGVRDFKPDGRPDGLLVYELIVEPTAQPPTARPQQRVSQVPQLIQPPVASVGGDQWAVPPTPTLPAVPPTPDWAGASAPATSSGEAHDTPARVTTTPAAEVSGTAAEAEVTRTPAPDSTPLPRSKATVASDTRGATPSPAASAATTRSPGGPEGGSETEGSE